jgi:hypothetical protein
LEAITLSAMQKRPDGDFTEALTDNYQKLFLNGRHEANRWIRTDIAAVEDGALLGSMAGFAPSPNLGLVPSELSNTFASAIPAM